MFALAAFTLPKTLFKELCVFPYAGGGGACAFCPKVFELALKLNDGLGVSC